MGRGQGRLNVSFVKDLKSYQAPHEVISLAEFIASDQPNHFTSVGDIVYLVGADEGNNQERCYLIEENDPVQAIEGLARMQNIEKLHSGVYRVVFTSGVAMVDVERPAIAHYGGMWLGDIHASLFAAMGYDALYGNKEKDEADTKLARAYYWYTDTDEATAEQLADIARAAQTCLLDKTQKIEFNPDDLYQLVAPLDAPLPQALQNLVSNQPEAYEEVWAEYIATLKRFRFTHSENPELDNLDLRRLQQAVITISAKIAIEELALLRQDIAERIFDHSVPAKTLSVEGVVDLMSYTLEPAILDVLETDSEPGIEYLKYAASSSSILQIIHEFNEELGSSAEWLEKLLPKDVRHQLDEEVTYGTPTSGEILERSLQTICYQAIATMTSRDDLSWKHLQDITYQVVRRRMQGPEDPV